MTNESATPQLSASVPFFPEKIIVKQNNGKEYLCSRIDGQFKLGTVHESVNGSGDKVEKVYWTMVAESRLNSQFEIV